VGDRLSIWDLEMIAQMMHPQGLRVCSVSDNKVLSSSGHFQRTTSVVSEGWRIDVSVGQGGRPLHVYLPAGPEPPAAADGRPGDKFVHLHMTWDDQNPASHPRFSVEYADGTFADKERMAKSIGLGRVTRIILKHGEMVARAMQQRRRVQMQEETIRIFSEMVRSGHMVSSGWRYCYPAY